MRNDNIYAALLDVLQPPARADSGAIFGTLAEIAPLTVRVGDLEITEGLFFSRGTVFYKEDIGSELALLPCEGGFLILFQTEEVNA